MTPVLTSLTPSLGWKVGFEVEMLAPAGSHREALAQAIAEQVGGRVQRFFHPASEFSLVPDQPVFSNLTLGFEVLDAHDARVATCVDDVTLQDDLDKQRAPLEGWYRIVSDDARLLRLFMRHADASAPIPEALAAMPDLFGAPLKITDEGMVHVVDDLGASIAIAAPLPGERERPCELVTAPISSDHRATLERLLTPAHVLGFRLPAEAALHIHYDAAPLCSARAIANLVNLLDAHGPNLRRLVKTNPKCRRLGPWPPALLACVRHPAFAALPWEDARDALRSCEPKKYCDYNLRNIAYAHPQLHTFEVRILPGCMDVDQIIEFAALFEAILRRAVDPTPVKPRPPRPHTHAEIDALLTELPLPDAMRRIWREKIPSPPRLRRRK